MRGLITYVLASLILLNIGGYHALFIVIQKNSSEILTQKLDDHSYNPDESFLVKMPLRLPYALNSRDFERVDGKFEFEGKTYRLVKQKMSDDTLHVVLLEDRIDNYINKVKTDFAKSLTDQPLSNSKSAGSKIFTQLIKDYFSPDFYLETANRGWLANGTLKQYLNFYSFQISSLSFIPPEVVTTT